MPILTELQAGANPQVMIGKLTICLFILLIAGCGRTGTLYLPEKNTGQSVLS